MKMNGMKPNQVTYGILIDAFLKLKDLNTAETLFTEMKSEGDERVS